MSKVKTKYKILIVVVAIIIIAIPVVQRIRLNSFVSIVEQTNTLGVINENKSTKVDTCNLAVLQNGNTVLSLFDETGKLNLSLIETINSAPSFIKNQLAQNIGTEFDKAIDCGAISQNQVDNAKEALTIF